MLFDEITWTEYLMEGNISFQRAEFEKAIEQYDKAIELHSESISPYNNRGLAKAALDRYEEAIADYNQAITLKPNAIAYRRRGDAKLGLGRYDEAIADYDQALTWGTNPTVCILRGDAKLELKRYDEAIADYNQAIKLAPQAPYPYHSRGMAHEKLGNITAARDDYSNAVDLATKQGEKELTETIQEALKHLSHAT